MKTARLVTATLLCVAFPLAARAVEKVEGGEGAHEPSLLWHAVNLALLIGLIVYFARKPIQTFMADRRSTIAADIEAAQRDLAEAERRLAECNERVASLDREIDEIRGMVRKVEHLVTTEEVDG